MANKTLTSDYSVNRRSGRSTRLIDEYIQELFTTGRVRVLDHHSSREAHNDLFVRVITRLKVEHGFAGLEARKEIKTFKPTWTIELINFK